MCLTCGKDSKLAEHHNVMVQRSSQKYCAHFSLSMHADSPALASGATSSWMSCARRRLRPLLNVVTHSISRLEWHEWRSGVHLSAQDIVKRKPKDLLATGLDRHMQLKHAQGATKSKNDVCLPSS